MKIRTNIFLAALVLLLAAGCEKGIDPISKVDPGPDLSAPVVKINYPIEGTEIRVEEAVTTIKIELEASDDIELAKVVVNVDGADVATFNSFKDYRRAVESAIYEGLVDGDHVLSVTATDLAGKSTTESVNFKKSIPYSPLNGEFFYLPLDGDLIDLVSNKPVSKVGSPTFTDGKLGKAYAGATDAYLTFPFKATQAPNEFSAAFWYKLNPVPDRAGVFEISAPGEDRAFGLRFAREADGANQKFFLNIGNGTAEGWFVPPSFPVTDQWMHVAISISSTKVTIYINGAVVNEGAFEGPINWAGCTNISIASGMPNFTYWQHFSDLSLYDEIRVFNRAITAEEVTALASGK